MISSPPLSLFLYIVDQVSAVCGCHRAQMYLSSL